ncbi:MACPF domain-containing protein 2 [Plakobranchus ocellatus]|uniref:MACPF domain-containing protein 2 n=1 Tax=Plakobranchus ocellatus TaxID=259542 RepID=A0AAV4DUX6_9GAST|nr:MACPF domain-containing protein 2 [Plakobranchus ocellatus]
MAWPHMSSACLSLALVLAAMGDPSQALLSDATRAPLTLFDLTYTPAHVVKSLTRNVSLLCAHQNDNQSHLQEITRIRLLKKTSSVWTLLAELRDNEDEPQAMFGGKVSAKISQNIREIFLQITWPVATEETFGTYRCDVIGFEWRTKGILTEVTSEVAILKGEVTADDMMEVFQQTSKELAEVKNSTNELKSFKNQLITWPEGQFALLQPKTGCPVDLTFFGGTERYVRIHTESSSGSTNGNSHSSVLHTGTLSRENAQNFFTLRFCEASGIFNTDPWPAGSYCINKINSAICPRGLCSGYFRMDLEDTNLVEDFTSKVTRGSSYLNFCCMSSGSPQTTISLPTRSSFILYRLGGQCQEVAGMSVSSETIRIDTEDSANNDLVSGASPDIDISDDNPTTIHLCFYT